MPWPNLASKTSFSASITAQAGLTAGEKLTLQTAVDSIAVAPSFTGVLVCDGDSLTQGSPISPPTGAPYPAQVAAQLGSNWTVLNFGAGGERMAQIRGGGATVDANYNAAANANVCVLWGGTNDLYDGRDPNLVYADWQAYCASRRTRGFKVVVVPVVARSAALVPASFEASRQTLNGLLRANWRTFADGICDVESDIRFANPLIAPFFDGVHLNATGYAIVADYVASSVLGLLP